MEDLINKKILAAGLGKSGISAANLLICKGANLFVYDEKPKEKLKDDLKKIVGSYTGYFGTKTVPNSDFDLVVTSPGIAWNSELLTSMRNKGVKIISEIELAARYITSPIIAITGTNGKTTTTSMITSILRHGGSEVFEGGNIGTPLSDYVISEKKADYVVCEVSSFQMEGVINFRPYISVVLNITPDHLDRHSSMEEYITLKKEISKNQALGDYLVLNLDDNIVAAFEGRNGITKVFFTLRKTKKDGAYMDGDELFLKRGDRVQKLCNVQDIPLTGIHNIENTLAAALVCDLCNVKPETIKYAITKFKGIKNRMEFVDEAGGVTYINDSKGTNTGAAIKSIKSFNTPIVLIAGGKDKGGDYGLFTEAIEAKVKYVVLIGEASPKIYKALAGFNGKEIANSLEDAVMIAARHANNGDTVLLSPACSSFDMFKDYEERGERFREAVKKIKDKVLSNA